MRSNALSFMVGLTFAFGLGLSGMTEPSKVIGFLNVFGKWDPSLIFVMIGAIAVHAFSYRVIRLRKTPLLDSSWHIPTSQKITRSLVIGSILFGIGWALAGFCPGPALVSLASYHEEPWLFMAGLLGGIVIYKIFDKKFQFKR